MENKFKHLEMIQRTVERMGNNSFLIKGWTITLVSALFALAAAEAQHQFLLICYFAVPMLWCLDAYYLSQERAFRRLYDYVRGIGEPLIDFSMDTTQHQQAPDKWLSVAFSKTIITFHGGILAIVLFVMFGMGS